MLAALLLAPACGSESPGSSSGVDGNTTGTAMGSGGNGSPTGSGGSATSTGSGGSNGPTGSGGSGNTGGSATGTGPDGGEVPINADGIIPADRRTSWQPGIPGGIPVRTTVCASIDAATYGNGAQDAGPAIQKAIDACPADQVVALGAGTFKTSQTLMLTKAVVLRGAGSTGGGHPATTINRAPAGVVIQIGRVSSTSTADAGTGVDLTADAANGSTTVALASAAGLAAGDIVQIDQTDDTAILNSPPYDCTYFKRAADRSIGQRIEIASINGNTLTLTSPLHWTFTKAQKAQVAPIKQPMTKYAGLEGVLLKGGNHPYDGGGVNVWNAAYSWVKDIETDTITGMHIVLSGTYRFVVRDSYVHHSGNYGFGTGCYGIVVRFQSADSLVENNIARYVNKPILFNASGGGNVIAYNYADDSWATPGWQELNIDCHCNYPHMELIEGNYAPHMGMSVTHGNAGYLTFYRNYSSSQFHEFTGLTGNVTAIELDTKAQSMNVVGNVLGSPGLAGALYEETSNDGKCGKPHVFVLGSGYNLDGCGWPPNPASDPAVSTLLRHGNFDYVTNMTAWDPKQANHTLPASLYLTSKPAFWPAAVAWPWTGPDLEPKVGALPAKTRFDNMK